MRSVAARRVVTAVAIVAVLAGCSGGPPNSVALSLYHRNLSGEPFSYRILRTPPGDVEWVALVPVPVSSAGCGFVMPDWELIVTEGHAPPEPDDDFAVHVMAAEFEARDPISVALSVEADGTVTVSEGVPAWWDSDIQRCP